MFKHFITFLLLCFSIVLFAQPENDDCSGIIDLGVAPFCPDDIFFTNVDATASDIGFGNIPSCFNGGTYQNDVWFAFTTSDTIVDYTITLTGMSDATGSAPLQNPQIALYRGACGFNGLAELLCVSSENGASILELDAFGLTHNVTYFIRINDYSPSATPNWGSFQLCIDETQPVNLIDEEGSTSCFGELYDSGGPDGDYSNGENYVFTICPSEFNNCILFTLDYYNIEEDGFPGDGLIFYDSDTNDPNAVISQINGFDFESQAGGGVCYQVQASSGCLTVEFISDANVSFEGFAGHWECTSLECDPVVPISVEGNIENQQIIDFISTPQTTVEITDINCHGDAYGTFLSGDNSDLGLEKGLLLTTGSLNYSVGPNNDPGGGNPDSDNVYPGDSDLDYLSVFYDGEESESNDACILELDVFVATNELTFEYIFGSDEYPEFVNSFFNDIFAFLISGPGIAGDPNINNQKNIATLPDGTPVQINSVNNLENWQYYRNNSNGQSVQYDGLTSDLLGVKKSLTARADVTPCNTYHLKLAIADRGDSVYDSGVFISELKGGTPSALVQYNSGIDYLIENCTSTPDDVIIKLSNALEDSITYNIIVGGTAVNGVDYLMEIPSSITFAPGETEASFSIMPLTDLEEEAVETVEISLVNNFGCGDVVYTTLVVELHDELNIEINAGQDTAFICQDSSLVIEVEGASDYFWTPLNIVSSPTSNAPSVSPPESQWIHVEGRIGNVCVDYDSIFLQIVDPEILAVALDPANICEGDSVKLQVTDNVNHSNLFWSPGDFISDSNSSSPVVKPPVTTSYIASVDVAGCIVRDTITVNVDPFDFPEITTLDTLICQNYSVILAEYIDTAFTSTTFEWTPADYLDDAFASGPLATPEVTTTYTLTATSENGYCSQTSSINIEVLPAVVDIQHPDTVEICLGESIDLFVETSTGGLHLSWFPSDSLSNTTETTVAANPTISTWYYTSLDVGECSVIDSVYVRVDSLPLLDIMAEPEKETYCEGEIITLFSNPYEPAHFSDIENLWIPETGTESPLEDWNLVLRGVEPLTYQRITTNHACVDTAEIFLDIVVTNELDITPDTLICLGESIQLNVSSPDTDEFEWSPEEGLSCIECADPIASPSNTTIFQVSADVRGCPVSGNVSIQVNTPPIFALPSQTIICFGESIQLNNAFDPGATYTWTSSDPTFGTLTDPMPVVTPTQNASYTVVAVNQYCPPEEREIEVVVVDQATLSVSEDESVCVGDPVTLSAEGSDPGEYFWNTGENTSSITVYPGQTMTFIISYTYGNNCGTLVDSIEVVVFENFDLEISTEPPERTIQQGQSVQLMAVTSLDNPESASYEWIENEILLSEFTTSNANVTPVDPVTVYEVTVISDVGCVNSAAIEFIVIPPTWKMPNVFAPDGVNKNFNILYVGDLEILDFSIFNRWGAVVYDNEDPSNGWNGNYKGNPAPSAVYIYVIKLRLPDGTEEILKGDVTLLR